MQEQLKTHQPPMSIDEQIDNLKDTFRRILISFDLSANPWTMSYREEIIELMRETFN